MSRKIFRSIMAVAMIVLLASLILTNGFLYSYFNRTEVDRLKEELSLAGAGVEQAGVAYFDTFRSQVFRFTWVSADGVVLYDSEVSADELENHQGREEITEALQTGRGSSTRYSATLTERTLYEAVQLADGSVLRISATQMTIGALLLRMAPAICAIVLCSVAVAVILSRRMAKSIVQPLNTLDLDHPAENDTYEELTPMLAKLNRQHRQIAQQLQQLRQQAEEFTQITTSMNEGLILLDAQGTILSLNAAAERLFDTDTSAVGKNFLTIDRHASMSHAVEQAFAGARQEFREERHGGEYQFILSRTAAASQEGGLVILCLDVTETAFAERNRQEFTANVSHELKTPLQSIIGSAELLESGLAKPEDAGRFVGHIKQEALRLISLINDIIRLSQLDENGAIANEAVDVHEVAADVCRDLSDAAAAKQVTLTLQGDAAPLCGVRRYLYEILFNLCDNAIRYNHTGGTVTVTVHSDAAQVTLTVCDTGIGIPPEHQSRVFERFYRVDKSHSKETGGTGLGLSIVKHAVAYHGGTVSLSSRVGEGTTVTIRLPRTDS